METSCRIYKPRRARESPLYRLVEQHLEELLRVWPIRFARQHGPLRPVVERVLRAFVRCGLVEHGFARLWCPVCRTSVLCPFSCRGTSFCPSCEKKRQLLWADYEHLMRDEGLPLREAVVRGSHERLAPVLMTALTAGLTLVPLVLVGHEPGTTRTRTTDMGSGRADRPGAEVCVSAYLQHRLGTDTLDLAQERAALARSQRALADLKLERVRQGLLLEDATAGQRAVATAAKASLLAVPRRAVLAGLPREPEDLVRRLIVEALRELARQETA